MSFFERVRCFVPVLFLLFLTGALPAYAQLIGSRHDFSLPGGSEAAGDACIFCHTPHTASPAQQLWNRTIQNEVYTPYSSSSMDATPGQPTGTSKLCLSCHDGTIAVSTVASRPFPVGQFGRVTGRTNLTTDLSDDHPVSFVFDGALAASDGQLAHPATLTGMVQLDRHGEMQCTSCHDAHSDRFGKFLVVDNQYSKLCVACHTRYDWDASAHANSPAPYLGGSAESWVDTQYDTVAANGCSNCHVVHAAGFAKTLLRYPDEEENCLVCHDGGVAEKDVASDFRKFYRHPVDAFVGVHDPEEQFDTMQRHVECQDCHSPHAAASWEAIAPNAGGPLNGASGVTLDGAAVEVARFEYEVCLRCHGDGSGQPSPYIERQFSELNMRLKIQPGNPSYHPIADPGLNPNVPSLRSPWNTTSIVYCGDCHGSDSGSTLAARGPHGSNWRFLLEREYSIVDGTPESQNAYDLCYKCHDRNNILSDLSFPTHSKHVVDDMTPCSVCHDPHGVSGLQAGPTDGSHLINFDVSIVTPDSTGRLAFEDLGENKGRCYLICHGKPHEPLEY